MKPTGEKYLNSARQMTIKVEIFFVFEKKVQDMKKVTTDIQADNGHTLIRTYSDKN
jgi:hypothetical protein